MDKKQLKMEANNYQLSITNCHLPKGYKNTEVGVIPEDWEVKELSDLTSLMTNGFVGVATTHYTEFEDGITYIQGYNVEENSFNFTGIKKVTKEFHKQHSKSCLQEGDLLTIQTGEVGLTTIVNKGLEGSNCHALIITRFKKNNSFPKFYSYYLNSLSGKKQLKEIETGSTMKHINVGDMIHVKVPVPTKSEQTAIATALSDADALINSLSTLIAKKRNIKQGAMQELLKPNPDSHREGWEVKKLGEIAEIYTGKKNNQDKVENGEYPFFVRSQTVERINTYSFDGEAILVPGEGNIGKIFHYINGKFDFHQRVYKISDFKTGYIGKYVYRYISENFGKHALENSVKATVDSLRLPTFQVFNIPFPPTEEEQTEIATILSDMDAEIQALETKLEKYRKIKLGMMQKLLTGKIRLV